MTRVILATLLAAAAASGCAPDVDTPAPPKEAETAPAVNLTALSTDPSQAVGLFRGDGVVKVGDTWEKARALIPGPSTAYELHDLPKKLPEQFEVKGWETSEGEGYGMILYQDRIVAAMYQLQGTKEDEVNEFYTSESKGMGPITPTTYVGNGLRFWFWKDDKTRQSTMMCAQQKRRGIDLTIAMGDDQILDVLGATDTNARKLTLLTGGKPAADSAVVGLR